MWRRFWFHSRVAAAEYAPEVLHAGWVPLLPAEGVVTAPVLAAAALPAHPAVATSEGAREQAGVVMTDLSKAGVGGTLALPPPIDADPGDLLVRFYLNQTC